MHQEVQQETPEQRLNGRQRGHTSGTNSTAKTRIEEK